MCDIFILRLLFFVFCYIRRGYLTEFVLNKNKTSFLFFLFKKSFIFAIDLTSEAKPSKIVKL